MRKNKLLVMLLVLCMSLFGLVACISDETSSESTLESAESGFTSESNSEEQTLPVTVTLDMVTASIDVYDTLQLTASVENSTDAVVWTSSNNTVASVDDNGLVAGLSEGTTVITATVGDVFATCDITVSKSTAVPELTIDTDGIIMSKGESYTVVVDALWKGNSVSGVTFDWSLDSESATGIIEMTANANGSEVEFTATEYGEVIYYVSATVYGVTLVEEVEIKVYNLYLTYEVSNFEVDTDSQTYYANVALSDKAGDITSITPDIKLYDNGDLIEGVSLEFVSSDENVAIMESGVVVPVGEGTTTFSTVYQGTLITFDVNVFRPEIEISEVVRIEQNNTQITAVNVDLSQYIDEGEIVSATVSGVEYTGATLASGVVSLDVASFGVAYGEQLVSLNVENGAEEYVVKVPVLLITKIIRTVAELDEFKVLSKATEEKENLWGGYFELGANIEYGSVNWRFLDYDSTLKNYPYEGSGWNDSSANGFRGVFDGCGYKINKMGFTHWASGFIGMLHQDGVIRNIAFTNVEQNGGQSVVSNWVAGTIENIYVQYRWSAGGGANDKTAVFGGGTIEKTAVIKDCFVLHSLTGGYASSHHIGLGKYHLGAKTYDGVYIVIPSGGVAAQACEDCEDAGLNVWGRYDDVASFLANKAEWETEFATWDTSFWALDIDGMPIPRCVYNEYASQQPAITNAETEIAAGASLTITATPEGLLELTLDADESLGVTFENGVITVPALVEEDVTITVTARNIYSELTASKTFTVKATPAEVIEIEDTLRIEQNNAEITSYTLDLSSYGDMGTLLSANIGGVAFDGATLTDNVLTLDVASFGVLYGNKVVVVETRAEEGKKKIEIPVLLITKIFRTKDELNQFGTYAKACEEKTNLWGGYFELGADIDFAGAEYLEFISYAIVYQSAYDGAHCFDPSANGFKGVFDGRGYRINAMKIAAWGGAFIGILHKDGIIRNVAFTEVKLDGGSSVVSASVGGLIENVYIQCSYVVNGTAADNTAFIGGHVVAETAIIRDCLIVNPSGLGDANIAGIGKYHKGYKNYDGVYVLLQWLDYAKPCGDCEDAGLNIFAGYRSRAKMLEDKATWEAEVATWDTTFWAIDKDGMPMPRFEYNALASQQPAITNTETEIAAGASLTITATPEGLLELTLDADESLGITFENGVITVPALVEEDVTITVTARNLYSELTASKTFTVKATPAQVIEVEDTLRIEQNNAEITSYTLDLSSYGDMGTLLSANIGGVAFDGATLTDNVLTLDVASFGVLYGNKVVVVETRAEDGKKKIEIPVLLITKIIRTKADLQGFIALSKACETEAHLWGGYFELGADIEYGSENWSAVTHSSSVSNWWIPTDKGFKGVFDGCGHVIDKMAFNTWGNAFISMLHQDGVIRNIAFTNVEQGGGNSVVSAFVAGTIENIYIQCKWSSNGGSNDKTAFIGGHAMAESAVIKDCFMLTNNLGDRNHSGLGNYHKGYKNYDGVYIILQWLSYNNPCTCETCASATDPNVWGGYRSRAKMLEAKANWEAEIATWDKTFWTTDADGLPIPLCLATA